MLSLMGVTRSGYETRLGAPRSSCARLVKIVVAKPGLSLHNLAPKVLTSGFHIHPNFTKPSTIIEEIF